MNLRLVPASSSLSGHSPARHPAAGQLTPARADDQAQLADLLSRSARGQEDAFAELYDATSAAVYGLVLRVLRAPDLAAEVTQEVYLEVWRQSARYDPDRGRVRAWISTLAHRRAVDRVRATVRQTARDDRSAQLDVERPAADDVWSQVDRRLDAERVHRALAHLTVFQREAITLAYFGGYTYSQVADLLSLPLGTVKTRIRDGLIRLRDALGVEA